ncbi:SDR family NAD(P)-dependent oxidoreductase [Paenibacillus sp. YYML68]|uniref:SDR family NAD(P)-dependent oxidoreductase n=1 Tax=Paenibacillus sp. YYML68 TaxID=2909250 RepID=UPI00248FEBE3|nr:SDR family NAD(P)-dependent oxidoreductase [Paenibacillus sp. YYML68]
MFNGSTILVTGGTGSWGHELVTQLLTCDPKEVIVFSRNESTQVAMKRAFEDDRLKFCIGDIRDREAVTAACKGVDYVFHLAALKHVPVCEDQPYEALKTNVHGTQHIIEAAIENKVKKVINISTDKAANPSNFYGMTKAIGEKLIIHANLLDSGTKFVCVRGGNVLGTNGSVIHLFKKQIRERGTIGLTHRDMTRFFLTQQEAISLLLKATVEGRGGEIFVMKMPTCKIIDLAQVLAEQMGTPSLNIRELGIRPGEKIHEILYSEYEAQSTVLYDEDYLVILPTLPIPGLNEAYTNCPKVEVSEYSSAYSLMSNEEIREMLDKGGFLS